MHILAVSDIHGRTDRLDEILTTGAGASDLLIVAGDMVRFLDADGLSSVVRRLAATHLPVLAVAGNCDGAQVDALLTKVGYNVRAEGRTVEGVGFCGVASAPPWVMTSWFVADDVAAGWIEKGYAAIADAGVKILIAHAPPEGASVETASGQTIRLPGSRPVREAVERLPFDAVICGHIHEGQGTGRIGECLVVCCGAAKDGRYARVEVMTPAGCAAASGSRTTPVQASVHRLLPE